ncbi:hypothetical protein GQ44DRAFT_770468 [Phaeosphaeriaceae sp. PMI808]|nr:hypothetical protein GQ44DRAFT_770468 [Phaeosphaeriaceae sp. PMI808]
MAISKRTPANTKVRASTIKDAGSGLFATQELRDGEYIGQYTGKTVFHQPSDLQTAGVGFFQISAVQSIEPTENKSKMYFINHNGPQAVNAEFTYIETPKKREVHVFATKPISDGEEIFCSYGENAKTWQFTTNGNTEDRKDIRLNDHLMILGVGHNDQGTIWYGKVLGFIGDASLDIQYLLTKEDLKDEMGGRSTELEDNELVMTSEVEFRQVIDRISVLGIVEILEFSRKTEGRYWNKFFFRKSGKIVEVEARNTPPSSSICAVVTPSLKRRKIK